MRTNAIIAGALALLLVIITCCHAKVILVSLDGFRHDYIEMAKGAGRNVSAFEEIANAGFRAEVQNVFITITFPTHYAIATGRYVENHGLYNNQFRDPKFKESFSYKKAEQQMDPKWLEYNNNEPIWLTNQRHGKRSCVFYWPGSNQPYKGKYPFATSGLYSDHPTFTYRVDRLMDWIANDEFTFCALYYNEPDHSGHAHGPNSTEVLDAIELVNDGIAYLLQRIKSHPKLSGKVNLIVTADHGMTYIPEQNRVRLYEAVNSSRYYGNISPPVVGIWPKGNETADAIYNDLMKKKTVEPDNLSEGKYSRKISLRKKLPNAGYFSSCRSRISNNGQGRLFHNESSTWNAWL
uniref:Ectonucleotide pyrophosphatase/phosphodiesterase family member 5 n=1 Tax=Schistocephalus solidus TaxID=70667 RepID=A0A0X3P1H0_SCHSO